jgi:hypothetical protein
MENNPKIPFSDTISVDREGQTEVQDHSADGSVLVRPTLLPSVCYQD